MNKNQNNMSLLAGVIVMAATAAIYLLSTQNIFKYPMCWIALSLILFSELLTVVLARMTQGNPIKVGVTLVGVAQTIITIVFSVFFINVLIFAYVSFFVSYIITFTFALIIIIILMSFANKKALESRSFKDAKINMVKSRMAVQGMINSENGKKHIDSLKKLDENLRFTDDSVIDNMDIKIYGKIKDLSESLNSETDVEKQIEDINDLVKQRNFVVKSTKTNS